MIPGPKIARKTLMRRMDLRFDPDLLSRIVPKAPLISDWISMGEIVELESFFIVNLKRNGTKDLTYELVRLKIEN
jgi:hypothetical protein